MYLRQQPNLKLFKFIPFNLGLYSISSPDTALWINRFLQKIGDAPVIYDSTLVESSALEIKKAMNNKGYLNAEVNHSTTFKKKKAKVNYSIIANTPYRIKDIKYRIKNEEIDFDAIFKDASWFHLSGISLALGHNVRTVALKCLQYCKKYNVTVSFDFNYRSKLWTIEESRPHFKKVIPYVDVLFANHFDIEEILEIKLDEDVNDIIEKKIKLSKKLISLSKVQYIFGTDRIVHTATDNSLSSYCICKNGNYRHDGPMRFSIYDRIGGGDAFASGVIHGLIKDFKNPEYSLKFGLATSVLEHTLYGDVSTLSEKEIQEFIDSNGNAAIQR